MLMKSLKQLEQLEARIFHKENPSIRDLWRMVRHLPKLVGSLVATLKILNEQQRKENVTASKSIPVAHKALVETLDVTTSVLSLSKIREHSRTGNFLIVFPNQEARNFTLNGAVSHDIKLSFGSSETLITHQDDYSVVIYQNEPCQQFRANNLYSLESGRIVEFLASGGETHEYRHDKNISQNTSLELGEANNFTKEKGSKLNSPCFDLEFELSRLRSDNKNQQDLTGSRLRESCYTNWSYVLQSANPHEDAFRYLLKISQIHATVLDIGANTGISALSIHKTAPNWPIMSFEALPYLEPMLKLTQDYFESINAPFEYRMTALAECDSKQSINIAVVNGAALDTMASFNDGQFEKGYIKHHLDEAGAKKWDGEMETLELDVRRFDGLGVKISTPHVFVKMDVEGYELKVLEGMKDFINTHRPAFLIESDAPQNVVIALNLMGYQPCYYHYNPYLQTLIEGYSPVSGGNFFFFPKNSPLFVI